MTYRLDIRSGAVDDIEEAYHWYENRESGLGDEFLRSLREGLSRIQEFPMSYAVMAARGQESDAGPIPLRALL